MRYGGIVWFLLSWAGLAAQGSAPDSIVNTIMEQTTLSGVLAPNVSVVLTSTGVAYRVSSVDGPLVLVSAYTWTKTGPNTGTLEFGTGASRSQTFVTFGASGQAGSFQDRLGGGVVTFTAFSAAANAPLRNVSNRATLVPGQSAIVGFVVEGSAPRRVLVRAIGPSLAQFGVAQPTPAPTLTVLAGTNLIGENSAWGGSASLTGAFASAGAFALPANSRDCALLLSLAAGNYTAQVRSSEGGEVLLEVYFVE